MTRWLWIALLIASCKKSEENPFEPPKHAEHQRVIEVSASLSPDWESKKLTVFVYLDPRQYKPSVDLSWLSETMSGHGEGEGSVIFEIPFAKLGPKGTQYKMVFDTFSEHGEGAFTFDPTPPLQLAIAKDTPNDKNVKGLTVRVKTDGSDEFGGIGITKDRKVTIDFTASPGATLTVEGVAKPTTSEPVHFELDLAARLAEMTAGDTLTIAAKLEAPDKRVIERRIEVSAISVFSELVFVTPGAWTVPGERAGAHHTYGIGVGADATKTVKLREIDRFARSTETKKPIAPCRYAPEGVTDPKEIERYTVFREIVTYTVTVYDRRAGRNVASRSWTGKPEACSSSVHTDGTSQSDTTRFTAGSEEDIAKFVASVR